MGHYLLGFISAIFRHGLVWWVTLFLAYMFGIGIFGEWPKVRAGLMGWNQSGLPEELSPWWLVLPFMTWLIIAFANSETMRRLRAGRIVFDIPTILRDVPLYRTGGVQVSAMDIVCVNVRNLPYDAASGKTIEQAYGSVSIYDFNWQHVKTADFLRWTEGQKTGYEGAPKDHFPHEWNFQALHPNDSAHRMDIFLKSKPEYLAYVLRGRSQLKPLWKDEEVAIEPGRYKVLIKVRGTSMKVPAVLWLEMENPGKDGSIRIDIPVFTFREYRKKKQLESVRI